jgi:hypothetical protein
MSPLGPPFPGEQVNFYDGSIVYWNIVPKEQLKQYPATITFTALNGTVIVINRANGQIIP